jgi:two-component system phosphate regulon sensor histidine kinase PhoR
MSDLRGLSPGSKTAAVVILVVLLQVIVVAVLGLGAIERDREEGARRAREQAESAALEEARRVTGQARDGLLGALQEAARIARNPGGLRNLPREGWYGAFRDLYRVDAEGRVRSAGGTLLHVPSDVAVAEEQLTDRVARDRAEQAIAALPRADPAAAETRRRFVRAYPFHTDGAGYATSVGLSLQLAEDAAASPSASPDAVAQAVLLAWETATVNVGRPAAAQPEFPYVRGVLTRIAAEPGRAALVEALVDLDRARASLDEVRNLALPAAQDVASHGGAARVFSLPRGGEVVALAPLPAAGPGVPAEALLARLDRRAIALLLETPAVTSATSPVRVVERAAPVSGPVPSIRASIERPDFDPGLDVVVQVAPGPAQGETAGPREGFYWTILGLAALGVTTAGVILVRILGREVHLARLKADFVSNLSHELKTPLTSISMFTEMLADDRLSPGDRKEAVDVIGQETDRLGRIVGRMIDVARREAGAARCVLSAGDLNVPVRAACERFRRLERDPGLDLVCDLSPDLPPVLLDADAIDDAVTNLLANAWKYRRGDRARVRVATRAVRRRVELTVSDDGIGIPRRDRRRVFDMFVRAENYLSRTVPGTGLGLSLVRTIVRTHRGRVRIEESAEGGTRFRIRLPAAKGRATPTPSPEPAPRARAARASTVAAARSEEEEAPWPNAS